MLLQRLLSLGVVLACTLTKCMASVEKVNDCCPSDEYCCGGQCVSQLLSCYLTPGYIQPPDACCKLEDCCPKGTFCCGDECVAEGSSHLCTSNSDCTKFCEAIDPCKQEPFLNVNPQTCEPMVLARWSFNQATLQCEIFKWAQCGKNENNFESQAICEKTCAAFEDCCPDGKFCCGKTCVADGTSEAPCVITAARCCPFL